MNPKSVHDEHWAKLVGKSVAFMVLATAYLFLVLCASVRLIDGAGPWFVSGHALEDGELFDATRNAVAFSAFTIAGGAAYLAYRRQRATDRTNALTSYRNERDELGELRARFTIAVEQLAHSSATVRIAGVYSLAAVADQWLTNDDPDQAQVAVDVLCGYLRLPHSVDLGSNHQTKRVVKTGSNAADSSTTEDHFEFLQNDRVVRETIASVIASKVRGGGIDSELKVRITRVKVMGPTSSGPWSHLKFDFTGAHFINADFESCQFDQQLTFAGAKFNGPTSFRRAVFGLVSFEKCEFRDRAIFADVRFTDGEGGMLLDGAKFRGPATFRDAVFPDLSLHNDVEFDKDAYFQKTRFKRAFATSKVIVVGELCFKEAIFEKGATFSKYRVGRANFSLAKFGTGDFHAPHSWSLTGPHGAPVAWNDGGVDFSDDEPTRVVTA